MYFIQIEVIFLKKDLEALIKNLEMVLLKLILICQRMKNKYSMKIKEKKN